MPAETHRHDASGVRPDEIADLLWSLVADVDHEFVETEDATLAALGVDAVGLLDLWEAVCEEFGERSLGPEFDPTAFEVTMTLTAAARAMANLLDRQHADS